MAFTAEQLAGLLFKKISTGKATANPSKQFFEEPRNARPFVSKDQVWAESDLIPLIAPSDSAGVVERILERPLAAIPGASASFAASGSDLSDVIPFNWGDGTSYNYHVKDASGSVIPFGQGDWFLDVETGVLTFFGALPANMPPSLSCWRYVGKKGLAEPPVLSVNGATGDVLTLNTLNDLKGDVDFVSQTGFITITTEASASQVRVDLTRGSMVEAINGIGGFFSMVGGPGIELATMDDGASGTMLVISRDSSGTGGVDHHHDGVDSPRTDYQNLLNRPVMVNRLADMDGTVDLQGTQGIVVQKDFDNSALVISSSGLASVTQLRTHAHDGATSSRIAFANLTDIPNLVNSLNGTSGDIVLISADGHLNMAFPSGAPNTIELSMTGLAEELHEHDYVHALNGLRSMPNIAGGDASIVVQASGDRILIFATGASGMYEGSGPPTPHAVTHATGGSDPLFPELIGAAPLDHQHDYAPSDHLHESRYSLLGHQHDYVTSLHGISGDLTLEGRGGLAIYPGASGTLIIDAVEAIAMAPHAASHALGGEDALRPIDIDAADRTHSHPHQQLDAVWDVNGYGQSLRLRPGYGMAITPSIDETYPASGTTTDLWLEVTASAGPHAAQHALGGDDPLTPADLGAAAAGHLHDGRYAFSDHGHDERYSQRGHQHDELALRTHSHDYIKSLNGIAGDIQVVGTRGISASLLTAASGSGYDYTLSIAITGAAGGTGGVGNGQQWTDELSASGNQSVFLLSKTLDMGIPIRLTVANVRQPQVNFAYDINTNTVVLQGWGARQGDAVFIDYSYL